jgi:ABC-type glycerol-3-phosphate transport system permease component
MSAVRNAASRLGCYGLLTLLALLALVPTLWVMVSSFKQGSQIYSGTSLSPHGFTLQGYRDTFAQIHLQNYLLNTLLYATFGTLGALSAALLAAYPIARFRFPFRNGLAAAFGLALAVPVVGLATPEFFIVRKLGLFDTKLGLILFYSALFFPLSFVILRAFLLSLPTEVEEAAMVEGAGYFTILRRIVIPLARPGLATVAVIVFIGIWNDFFFANLLTASPANENVQLALAGFRSAFGFNVTGALAGATLVMLVPVAAFLILQRQVIAGLTAGATK